MCEECGQRPATVHVARRVNGHQTEMHLCAQCAMEKGEIGPLMQSPAWMLEQFLAALGGLGVGSPGPAAGSAAGPAAAPLMPPGRAPGGGRCPACGLPFQEFARTGMLGCAHCYEAFRHELGPAIRRIHGAARHVGHRPPDGPAPRPSAGDRPLAAAPGVGASGAAASPETPAASAGPQEPAAERVARLRAELQKAIAEERYEDAARLRDEIRALTKE
ncbi:MAG: UvrB/UvrC motif-containing protein [Firmicutes bacterium]|nr:UvrB/UvrC motif-containing protein [Bacillota bacterium]